eukprot:gene1044-1132_t
MKVKNKSSPTSNLKQAKLFSAKEKVKLAGTAAAAVVCPVCQRALWTDLVFTAMHIDHCLEKAAKDKLSSPLLIDLSEETEEEKEQEHDGPPNKRQRPQHTQSRPADSPCPLTPMTQASPALALSSSSKTSRPFLPVPVNLRCESVTALPGIFLLHNFLTSEEETEILHHLDNDQATPWRFSSFNGHCQTKVFGLRSQFGLPNEVRLVRKNRPEDGEYDIPDYLRMVIDRVKVITAQWRHPDLPNELNTFQVNECNANSYHRSEGDYLKPHYDDRFLSGPLLLNLSLVGDCSMTYHVPNQPGQHRLLLSHGTLQIISKEARWNYMHAIHKEDFLSDRRVSITFRQVGGKGGTGTDANKSQQLDSIWKKSS